MDEKTYIKSLAHILALPIDKRNLLVANRDRYLVMGVKPYHFICYSDVGEMLVSFEKEEATNMCQILTEKNGDAWFEYAVFKLSRIN